MVPAPHTTRAATPSVRRGDFTRQHGITRQLLSLVTASPDDLISQIQIAAPRPGETDDSWDPPRSPFLARQYCGAHNPALLRDPDPDLVERLLAAADGTLRQVTMAPERAHFAESARILREAGVVVAVGHTAATFEQARAAIEAGRPYSVTPSMGCRACIIVRPGQCSHSLRTPVVGWR